MADSFPRQLIRTQRFTRGEPTRFTIAAGGATVLFLRSRAGDDPVTLLWALDVDTGAERLLADPGAAISTYAVDASGEFVAFVADGALWTVAGGQATRLATAGPVADPRPDPAGRRIAYVSGGALRVIEADGTGDRVLAGPDGPDVTFGLGGHTFAVSPDGERGFWWAPDGDRLLVSRLDWSAVQLWHIGNPAEPVTPPRTKRYAAVGTANVTETLWLAGLDGDRVETAVDAEYVIGAGWDAHGPYAVGQTRDQRTVRFLGIDDVDGTTTVLAEQRDESWVQPIHGVPARTAAGAVVSHADRDGTRYLAIDGTAVTPPGLQLRAVLSVDGDEVFFTASDDPFQTHLWLYDNGVRKLTAEPAVHSGARRDGTTVDIARPHITVRRGDSSVAVTSHVEAPVLELRAIPLVLGPRALRARLHLPSWHQDGPLPVLLDSYGGAGSQRVTAEADYRWLVSQWFAEHGFAVLAADGAGTPGRGPDWEREVSGDLFDPVLADQVAALHEAAALHPELDLGRVGIRGWSFGGSLAAWAVLRRPDVFHAAVAGAGVTDQYLYNAYWRERFLGHPGDFPERYAATSLVGLAPTLSRPLLLMHGTDDDNVFLANTLRFSEALLAAGRQHDLLVLPGISHQAMGIPQTEELLQHQLRFLQRHLGAPTP